MKPARHSFLAIFFVILSWGAFAPDIHAAPAPGLWDDLLPHGDFPIEWWYMTGFLRTEKGRNLGFQATFFCMKNNEQFPGHQSARGPWAPREIFGFHGAVSDLDRKTFVSTERERRGFRRSVATQDHPFSVSIGRNRLDHKDATAPTLGLSFRVADQSFDLTLTPLSPPVWHAAHKKFFTGPRPIDYAYYYSYPLVKVEGTRTIVHRDGTATHERVRGQCWFDHEWMAQTLAPGQIGWIWLWAWNKENTRGIMLYQMLDRGGKLSPFHRATVITKTHNIFKIKRIKKIYKTRGLSKGCINLKRIEVFVNESFKLKINPLIINQKLSGGITYWEGASSILIAEGKKTYQSSGYLEITGISNLKQGELCADGR